MRRFAYDLVLITALGGHVGGCNSAETSTFRYIPEAERRLFFVDREQAVSNTDIVAIDSQLVGCEFNEYCAHFGCGSTYCRATDLNRTTAIGIPFIRR